MQERRPGLSMRIEQQAIPVRSAANSDQEPRRVRADVVAPVASAPGITTSPVSSTPKPVSASGKDEFSFQGIPLQPVGEEVKTPSGTGTKPGSTAERLPQEVLASEIAEKGLTVVDKSELPRSPLAPDSTLGMDITNTIKKLKEAFERISRDVVGVEPVLMQTIYALLTREHQLIYSRAGMAKSLYASTVFNQFKQASTFSTQLTKGTTEEGLVGAINIEEFKKGNVIHNTSGSIVEARFAFLDELFDANDVALRSLLGILNERLFRKGKQKVEAVLHTAIATSNYVRSSEVTEAVIDRFPFRSVLKPNTDPYHMLRIDEAYEQKVGKVSEVSDAERIPFAEIEHLADIVEGRIEDERINAPAHVLVLKNAIILQYVNLVNEERKKANKPLLYISPRTIAKTRDILNASALLHGRKEVNVTDLKSLKYMICTIGDDEGQDVFFDKALKQTVSGMSAADRKTVDTLVDAHELLQQVLEKVRKGERMQTSFIEKIKMFFGVTSLGNLTFDDLEKVVTVINAPHPTVNALRDSIVGRIVAERELFDRRAKGTMVWE